MPENKPTVVIYGTGLIGMFLASHLINTREVNVYLIGRQSTFNRIEDTVETTSINGFKTRVNKTELNFFSTFQSLPSEIQKPDYLILTMKRQDTEAAIKDIDFSHGKTTIVALQNGARQAEKILEYLEDVNIVEGMWPFNVVESSPGKYQQSSSGSIYLTESEKGIQLKDIFVSSNLECNVSKDMDGILYGKLLINLNNAVCALSGLPILKELQSTQYRRIWANCIWEGLKCYAAAGIYPISFTFIPLWIFPWILWFPFPMFVFQKIGETVFKVNNTTTSSLYEDLKNKKPTCEIEYLQGEIVRLGEEMKVPTPVCLRVKNLVDKAIEKKEGLVVNNPEVILDWIEMM
ncbi:hypothetical protein HDU92_005747 [Lobulomyces angularis]|nr:hypothetical protein HDU92_005747 [Lobulomyces angularis]